MDRSYLSATALSLLLMLLASCAEADLSEPMSEERHPHFTAALPLLRVQESRWDAGDCIGISSADGETNVPYQTLLGDGSFTPLGEDRFTLGKETQHYSAYYPYSGGEGRAIDVDLLDQTPLLYGEGESDGITTEVELHFSHRLAQLRVYLISEIEGLDPEDAIVRLQGYPTSGTMDRLSGDVTVGEQSDLLSMSQLGSTFTAYLLPGSTVGDPQHKILIDIGTTTIELTEPSITGVDRYESGKYYLVTIHLRPEESLTEGDAVTGGIRAFVEGGSVEGDIFLPSEGPDPDDGDTGDPSESGPGGILLQERFTYDLGRMMSVAVLGKGIDFEAVDGCATVSGYELGMTEIYLLSPPIDLRGATAATISFDHNITYAGDMPAEQQLLVTTDDVDLRHPDLTSWTRVTIPNYPDGVTSIFSSNEIPLPKDLLGQQHVRFAFRYRSRQGREATWRIDDLIFRTTGGGALEEGSPEGPDEPTDPEVMSGDLLFPGADCEDDQAFLSKIGQHKMQSYASFTSDRSSPERGRVLAVQKQMKGNDYLFSVKGTLPRNTHTISFLLKGTTTDRSLSVNLYTDKLSEKGQQDYVCYNLGDVRTRDLTVSPSTRNLYSGTIDTRGDWVRVSLDVGSITTNSDPEEDLFAVKIGGPSDVKILLDDFRVE